MPEQARFNWLVVQDGALPLRPDKRLDTLADHRCTSVLIWPEGEPPSVRNTLLVDPCFSDAGYDQALDRLETVGIGFDDVGHIFVTHLHSDHMLHLPWDVPSPRFRSFRPGRVAAFDGITAVNCPGHHPLLLALVFTLPDGRAMWVVSDAVLDEDWLRAWGYYWPNGYAPDDVVETWRSVGTILARADVIVPGHGLPITVTPGLLRDLLATFPHAPYADRCPDVADILRLRLAQLHGAGA